MFGTGRSHVGLVNSTFANFGYLIMSTSTSSHWIAFPASKYFPTNMTWSCGRTQTMSVALLFLPSTSSYSSSLTDT